ncbi:TetR/AcrR family transcriptional regulator [Hyphomicrobium facile]|uniref:DNA-binding transcriptional regulator, AcrR family n=1 Tax=Hyphomicrobium facile TaxID=51670 RepID=A0A1I7NQ46_9HYPH|nr:TetR/AcrR family transcriptional regulator [Hyphomicrobium facile]SFV36700.1 DNA-binding transcriptional regulator, AcrR family [Hyphomicrobium facile]
MISDKPSLREQNRRAAREAVLDAAERLLESSDTADFSMRSLAAEAGVGFATPFNHFGSKAAIMQALSMRWIGRMENTFGEATPRGDAVDRVLKMGRIAVSVLREQADVSKRIVGSLGTATGEPGAVMVQSTRLWATALGDLRGVAAIHQSLAKTVLPRQLAYSFRGCISFWVAGETADDELEGSFEEAAASLMLGFLEEDRRGKVVLLLKKAARR